MPDQNTPKDPLAPNIPDASAPAAMPLPAVAPAAPVPAPATSGASHVDFDKLLLPKGDRRPQDSAQRINAGALFEQEQTAGKEGPPKEPAASAPAPIRKAEPEKKEEETHAVRPLQTYQGDIESLVGEKQVSVVSIAAAEADRRGMSKLEEGTAPSGQEGRPWLRKIGMVLGGLALLAAAGGIGFYIYLAYQPVSVVSEASAPFISVDATQVATIHPEDSRSAIMQALVAARNGVQLSLGLIARVQVVKPSVSGDGTMQEIGAPELLPLLAPAMPQELLRTLEPQMLLGVHSYDENQAFMILKADAYETAYSGMLAWEASMRTDLLPLFSRTPAVRARAPVPAGPVASTTTLAAASSTASTTPKTPPTPEPAQFFLGNFIDQIVENRDTRAVLNPQGDILLLWTFLDRSTIVITTNEATLREVISKLTQASLLSLPAR